VRKVIISGATGFVGSNLQKYLHQSYKVSTVSRRPDERSSIFAYDELDKLLSEESDFIHLAGKAHDLKKISDPSEYYQVNYELTKKLYDVFIRSKASKFIFISSVKAVADSAEKEVTEEHVPDPKTDYGKSKLMAEEYIQKQVLPAGKSYFIIRPCMIHGAGNKGNLNLLYKFVSYGLPYPLAAFENKRSFLSVENLCFIIKEILQSEHLPSGVYNAADDEALSTSEVVTLLARSVGKKPVLLYFPKSIIAFLAKTGDILRLPFSTEHLKKLTENYIVNNNKIKAALGKQLPLSVREGITKTGESFNQKQTINK